MKLDELKAKIDNLVDSGFGDYDVMLSADPEGNSFEKVDCIVTSLFNEHDECIHPDDIDEYDNVKTTVVIWP